jgi:hypothetical protein
MIKFKTSRWDKEFIASVEVEKETPHFFITGRSQVVSHFSAGREKDHNNRNYSGGKAMSEHGAIDLSKVNNEITERHIDALLSVVVKRLTGAAFDLIENDPHQWSARPCQTCQAVSSIIGRPFGCQLVRLTQKHEKP